MYMSERERERERESTGMAAITAAAFVVLAVVCNYPSVACAADTIFLQSGGSLNGQTIDATNYWITVDQGAAISGTIKVQTNNMHGSAAVAPFGYTATWGDRTTQPVTTNSWITTGLHNYDINVNKTAPDTPGTYYLPIAFDGCYNIAQVMSSTHPAWPAVWHDGNDVGWDWTPAQYQQARDQGLVTFWRAGTSTETTGGSLMDMGANWVGVNVVTPEPATLSLLALGGLALLRRRRR